MVRLKLWQWVVLAAPIALIVTFLLVAAGSQIHAWGLSWIWAVFTLIFVGWRWLLVKWTRPEVEQLEAVLAEVNEELAATIDSNQLPAGNDATTQAQAVLSEILQAAQSDRPIWEDWSTFWTRCQNLVVAIAHIYHPEVKYPLLNIYVTQAYGLIRGTVDDLDQWIQRLSPALNQVTVGQAYQAYEVYRKLEPSARKLWQAWNWAQWLLNPAAAFAKKASQRSTSQANQQLLVNLSQMLREAALRNLCRQAIALYSGSTLPTAEFSAPTTTPALPKAKTQTLREILTQAEPAETVAVKPVNILLVGRTGSGKSSLINTLFQSELAAVDVLPSTDQIQNYQWQTGNKETLTLWDTPGYEQANRSDFRDLVLDYATKADLLLLVTPALDPALQMDVDFLKDMQAEVADLPVISIVTQVDRLRPIREWQPPYDWEWGDRPKEISIREATQYRAQLLGDFSKLVLPVVTSDRKTNRAAWGIEALSLGLVEAIAPAKQLRLARFLRNLEARTVAAAKIIDNYTFQMATTQGLTSLLKSPVLQFISTLSTGSPTLAYLLAEKIPVEQLPVVIGKLQMAYDLFSLLNTDNSGKPSFDLLALWPLLLENTNTSDVWAFGHALVEYWTQNLTIDQLRDRFNYYLNVSVAK
ncbi:GTP-binding protein HSR1-related protein [Tolypothrix tenuis PCC 7101]|uniref:GTP-binding protein HSR1-related protein n=1 Tax=Tolypothrix tenuis PCC 7101 TaxID=231146 RepID=A0A1Z4MTG2_9CYAN|nr:GTPase family protein [Aulosira sp. FACHB-113]BAY96768.1 GTP-binding protein HSR1-related protein [Tolypothrix tenuis PCC 7101]BAZ72724.1 GTP-binding protein HSR1-related protein [Aulosira laxa NIES-50]